MHFLVPARAVVVSVVCLTACGGGQDPKPGEANFRGYFQQIADDVNFEMIPIAGGSFRMGSPDTEPGRAADEGPQIEVRVDPFWIQKCEVTWAQYDVWNTDTERRQSKEPDGLSRPTPAYMDMTFNMGRDGYPAICMSHAAARQYCKWLSEKTSRFYRLPTEAEWEYVCRAGTDTAWACSGDPMTALAAAAWFDQNSARVLEPGTPPVPAYHQVGQKKPNAWGVCDLQGNVAEWVADHYLADAYAAVHGPSPRKNPYFQPPRDERGRPVRFPHVVRGGSWRDAGSPAWVLLLPVVSFPPPALRAAARRSSEPAWNERDPQIPKSWWYLTEGQHIGFRVVRPLREPSPEERARFENLDQPVLPRTPR